MASGAKVKKESSNAKLPKEADENKKKTPATRKVKKDNARVAKTSAPPTDLKKGAAASASKPGEKPSRGEKGAGASSAKIPAEKPQEAASSNLKTSDVFSWAIPPEFNEIGDFVNYDLAYARGYGYVLPGYIDKNGAWRIKPSSLEEVWDFYGELALVSLAKMYGNEFKAGYINTEGQLVSKVKLDYGRPFINGLAAAREDVSDKHGYIDKNGEWAIKPRFDLALEFNDNGLAIVCDECEKVGWLIDRNGKKKYELANLRYEKARNANMPYDNSVPIQIGDKWGLMSVARNLFSKPGKWLLEPVYDHISSFYYGYAFINKGGSRQLIDSRGKSVLPPEYEVVAHALPWGILVRKDGNLRLLDGKKRPIEKFNELPDDVEITGILSRDGLLRAKIKGADLCGAIRLKGLGA